MDIGIKLRNAREDKDLSQYDMARQIPMNQSNYSKIERGIQEPNLQQLKRICQILELNPCYLLDLKEYKGITAGDMQLLGEIRELIAKWGEGK